MDLDQNYRNYTNGQSNNESNYTQPNKISGGIIALLTLGPILGFILFFGLVIGVICFIFIGKEVPGTVVNSNVGSVLNYTLTINNIKYIDGEIEYEYEGKEYVQYGKIHPSLDDGDEVTVVLNTHGDEPKIKYCKKK